MISAVFQALSKINMKRRTFFSMAAMAAGLLKSSTLAAKESQAHAAEVKTSMIEAEIPIVLPAALRKGSTIGITAPASGVDQSEVQEAVSMLKSYGCNIVLGNTITRKYGYLSAPDSDRASEFMEFVERRDIDCILCARGGYGVMRILPMLDFSAIRKNPKIIIGYSDITALLLAVHKYTNLVTFHGPVASSSFDPFTLSYFLKTLFSVKAGEIKGENKTESESGASLISYTDSKVLTLNTGVARGRLTGGNLSMIVSTLGTPYEINTRDALLFLEDVSEEPYKIDRMLTQLWLAGKLQQCNGIVLGQFKNCEAGRQSGFDVSFSLQQVLEARIQSLGIPAVYGMPFGHVRSKLTMPVGIMAELNAADKTFTLLEKPVQ